MWVVKHKRDVLSPKFKLKREAVEWMNAYGGSGCYVAGGGLYGL